MPRRVRSKGRAKKRTARRWSQRVTDSSNALDLEPGVFRHDDPGEIARSLRRSAQRSRRRLGTPYASAMSMLTFYINRAGRRLPAKRRRVLEAAKDKLRALYRRPPRHGKEAETSRPTRSEAQPSGGGRAERERSASAKVRHG
jgi:hypothetical protein